MKRRRSDIEKEKIPHPYRVPDNFFADFKTEILETVSKAPQEKQTRIIRLAKKVVMYAAVLFFGFFAVKGIISTFHGHFEANTEVHTEAEIDAIYSQISDDDITNFIIDGSSEEIAEILDF